MSKQGFIGSDDVFAGGKNSKLDIFGDSSAAYKLDGDLDKFIRGIAKYYATAPTYADQIIQLAHAKYVVDAVTAAREA